jgi:hypothetical protein
MNCIELKCSFLPFKKIELILNGHDLSPSSFNNPNCPLPHAMQEKPFGKYRPHPPCPTEKAKPQLKLSPNFHIHLYPTPLHPHTKNKTPTQAFPKFPHIILSHCTPPKPNFPKNKTYI